MPNWCQNKLTISHADQNMIKRALDAFNDSRFFNEFVPVPQELVDTISGFLSNEQEQQDLELRQQYNLKNFGYMTWYEFCIAEWGTKWDVEGEVMSESPNELTVFFDSAWAPPIKFYEKLEELGFVVHALYYEGGMCFCGEYVDGVDNYINMVKYTSEWVMENVPNHIDEAFAISEQLIEEEAQDEDEENA